MKSRCCRSLPRCATCPVVLAAQARVAAARGGADLFELLRPGPPPELPACVRDALRSLDERRFGPMAPTEAPLP
jgi:hypothetical protein